MFWCKWHLCGLEFDGEILKMKWNFFDQTILQNGMFVFYVYYNFKIDNYDSFCSTKTEQTISDGGRSWN